MSVLRDHVIVVTGAGRGIGRAHAKYVASQGARVVVNDLGGDWDGIGADATPAQSVVGEITAAGGTAVADGHDIATDGEAVIQTALDEFGRIDGLVNNAGVIGQGQIDDLSIDQIERNLDIILLGAIRTSRAAWGPMKAQKRGRIVNTSSCAVFGVSNALCYLAGKAGIIGVTRALAKDGEPFNIKVNAIMPLGYSRMADTQADLSELWKEHMAAELISPLVGALLTDDAPCTGEVFTAGGGRAARVFLGTVPGLVGFKSIEEVLEGFDQMTSASTYVAPTSMDEEIQYEFENLGIDFGALGINMDELGTGVPSSGGASE